MQCYLLGCLLNIVRRVCLLNMQSAAHECVDVIAGNLPYIWALHQAQRRVRCCDTRGHACLLTDCTTYYPCFWTIAGDSSIQNNQLTALPENMLEPEFPKLRWLYFQNNQLGSLPENVTRNIGMGKPLLNWM